jgi:hypothetical protein
MASHSQTHDPKNAGETPDGKTAGGALDIHEKDVIHISTDADLKAGDDRAAKPSTHAENTKRADR